MSIRKWDLEFDKYTKNKVIIDIVIIYNPGISVQVRLEDR